METRIMEESISSSTVANHKVVSMRESSLHKRLQTLSPAVGLR